MSNNGNILEVWNIYHKEYLKMNFRAKEKGKTFIILSKMYLELHRFHPLHKVGLVCNDEEQKPELTS